MKKILCLFLLVGMMCLGVSALAAREPLTKELEDTITYESDTLKINIDRWHYTYKQNKDVRFFIVDVVAERPEQMQTAFAYEEYAKRKTEWTSIIASRHDAVLAINGDYYNHSTSSYNPFEHTTCIRNGVLYTDLPSTRDHLLAYADGHLRGIPSSEYEAGQGQAFLDEGVVQAWAFGPLLVNDGEIVPLPEKYIINTKSSIYEPRCAIGWVDGTHYIIVIADGRRNNWSNTGMSLLELQNLYYELGVQVAYNMDGGGSATLILNGEKINRTSGSHERDVSDIIYFTN